VNHEDAAVRYLFGTGQEWGLVSYIHEEFTLLPRSTIQ
jgi:hypothetical protein